MTQLPPVEQFIVNNDVRLYRIPTEVFPDFIAYVYVILGAGVPTLVDTGSGIGESTDHILAGIASLQGTFGENIAIQNIERILVTHGHIDHLGGLASLYDMTHAQIGVHALDLRVVTHYEERVIISTKDVRAYLEKAGVSPNRRQQLIEMYGFAKKFPRSVPVTFTLDPQQPIDGMQFIHTPGHCPGQVCILIGDVLLSADHVLAKTTPHQSPESIAAYTGLGHYLDALDKVQKMRGIRLTLGGHETPIDDVYTRIDEIRASHQRKLERVRQAIRTTQPCTISDISKIVYPEKHGYEVLLALEEIGAHVEYLYQHGELAVANLEEIEREENPAIQYVFAQPQVPYHP